jgi:hypothetical protein
VQQANPDITFVGIAAQDNEDAMRSFVDSNGVGGFPNVNDANGELWRQFGISYQPSFVFLDAEGNATTTGGLGEASLQQKIDELLS